MVKYRVVIDKERCDRCGISIGRCPTHARLLAQILKRNNENKGIGIFSDKVYDYVKQLVEACPEKALIIEKVET